MVALCFLPKWKERTWHCKKLFTCLLLCTHKPFTGCFATKILLTGENSSFLLFANPFKTAVLLFRQTWLHPSTWMCKLIIINDLLLIIHFSDFTNPYKTSVKLLNSILQPWFSHQTSSCLSSCLFRKSIWSSSNVSQTELTSSPWTLHGILEQAWNLVWSHEVMYSNPGSVSHKSHI